jgi:hypothetical protein
MESAEVQLGAGFRLGRGFGGVLREVAGDLLATQWCLGVAGHEF